MKKMFGGCSIVDVESETHNLVSGIPVEIHFQCPSFRSKQKPKKKSEVTKRTVFFTIILFLKRVALKPCNLRNAFDKIMPKLTTE